MQDVLASTVSGLHEHFSVVDNARLHKLDGEGNLQGLQRQYKGLSLL